MNVYVDFDDILCETASSFSDLVKRLFDIDVPYERIEFFDLQKTFGLTEQQYEEMMIEGHKPEILLAYKETEGASSTINKWLDEGHQVSIITGRPYSAYEPSRRWLDEHNLSRLRLFCLNKYGRDSFIKNSSFSLEMDDFFKMDFDFAIEDSPLAFKHLNHFEKCKVAVFDRPWNKNAELPTENYVRCKNWQEIAKIFDEQLKR